MERSTIQSAGRDTALAREADQPHATHDTAVATPHRERPDERLAAKCHMEGTASRRSNNEHTPLTTTGSLLIGAVCRRTALCPSAPNDCCNIAMHRCAMRQLAMRTPLANTRPVQRTLYHALAVPAHPLSHTQAVLATPSPARCICTRSCCLSNGPRPAIKPPVIPAATAASSSAPGGPSTLLLVDAMGLAFRQYFGCEFHRIALRVGTSVVRGNLQCADG